MRTLHGAMVSLFSATLVVCAFSASACTSSTKTNDGAGPSSVDVNDASALKAVTDVEATATAGSQVTVQYVDKPAYTQIPYLAVELATQAQQTITVTGTFPSKTPTVFVVDDNFAVVAMSSSSVVQPDGSSITTVVAPVTGKSVVVHDADWSAPMSFNVNVGP